MNDATTTAADDKAFATLQAHAALSGFTCTHTAAGNIVLARFGGGWIFDTVADAGGWLADTEEDRRLAAQGTIEGEQL